MELKETAEMMCSPDYKERFKAEYYQLKIRLGKLKAMLAKWEAEGNPGFKADCPPEIYTALQVPAMESYLAALVIRAKLEHVELEEEA